MPRHRPKKLSLAGPGLSRRDFARAVAAMTALVLVGPRGRALAATPPEGELNRLLLGHCLRQAFGDSYPRLIRVSRELSGMNAGQAAPLDAPDGSLDATGRRGLAQLGTAIDQARARVVGPVANASDLLGLAYLPAHARDMFVGNGLVDFAAGQLADYVSARFSESPEFRALAQGAVGWVQAFPALQKFGDRDALLGLASPLLRDLVARRDAFSADARGTMKSILAKSQTTGGRPYSGAGVDEPRNDPAFLRRQLADVQQAVQLCGPVLRALGLPATGVSRFQQGVQLALTLGTVVACPWSATGALSLLGSLSGLLGGMGGDPAARDTNAAAFELLQKSLAQIFDQLQRIEQNQIAMMRALEGFFEASAENQQRIINDLQSFASRIEAGLNLLQLTAQQRTHTEFRTRTYQTLQNLRQSPNPERVFDYVNEIAIQGEDVPGWAVMSAPADVFQQDALALLQGKSGEMLATRTRCEFLAPAPAGFRLAALPNEPGAAGSINPVAWLHYINGLCEVAFLADAKGVVPFTSAKAADTYLPAIARLQPLGAKSGAWFRAIGSPATAREIAARVRRLIDRPETLRWVERAVAENRAVKLLGPFSFASANFTSPEAQPDGQLFWRQGTWARVTNNPLDEIVRLGYAQLREISQRRGGFGIPPGGPMIARGIVITPKYPSVVKRYRIVIPGDRDLWLKDDSPIGTQKLDTLSPFGFESFWVETETLNDRNLSFWKFGRDDAAIEPDGLFEYLFDSVQARQCGELAPHLGAILTAAVRNLPTESSERNALLELVRTSMLANLVLAVNFWRRGVYGTTSPAFGGHDPAVTGLGHETPFAYGHRADLIFSPAQMAELCQRSAQRAEVMVSEGFRPKGPGSALARTLPAFLRVMLLSSLRARVDAFVAAVTDPGEATIPPIELGLAKLAALRASLPAG